MSLADELAEATQPSPTEAWIADWHATLDDADKTTFLDWSVTPGKSVASMYRALERRGYPHGLEALRRWKYKQHRDAS